MGFPTKTIEPTQNEAWGFYGTVAAAADPAAAWVLASRAIGDATGEAPWSVRAFLDSRHGRHFADDVVCKMTRRSDAASAIAATVGVWMGWRTSPADTKSVGIPTGLPYLTGYVVHCGIEDEATAG